MLDVRRLRFFGTQEFSSRGQVEKKLAHLDARARRATGGFHFHHLPAVHHDARSLDGFGLEFRPAGGTTFVPWPRTVLLAGRGYQPLARGERESAHAGDARKRLAAKAHRADDGA